MGVSGVVDGPVADHVCWSYDEPGTFDAFAEGFLADGVAAGHQVWCVAPAGAVLAGRLRERFPAEIRRGAVRVVDPAATYVPAAGPHEQVRLYADATDAALAAGYGGLRVAADVTAMLHGPEQVAAFARYEHHADRLVRARPFSAVCGYDRRALGAAAVERIACLHTASNVAGLPFRLSASAPGGGAAELAGEVDAAGRELFADALELADLRPTGGELVLDAAGLRFADHRALLLLDAYARERAAVLVLRGAAGATAHVAALLGLAAVRVEGAR
ncbi:MEDS domain-containing protein [Spirilliplanes yamanashiensis]|uniref:MEDS domain-containing protein n=1 Tax=Spirilliplanes yamanashiensis TaxID=42233 RepID=A0A8J3YCS3_9ACTN|nr:MEDS domain-containing protein [Spirilliplanes yamanashiensis]MDP9819074.1 hypothetical protein [Spirilliplanes yamanashiensis]GIJ05529.1 hypothetical protein Sya03_48810 [Spirilliplanes yamanashiensis]